MSNHLRGHSKLCSQQECIPVGCVQTAYSPYSRVSVGGGGGGLPTTSVSRSPPPNRQTPPWTEWYTPVKKLHSLLRYAMRSLKITTFYGTTKPIRQILRRIFNDCENINVITMRLLHRPQLWAIIDFLILRLPVFRQTDSKLNCPRILSTQGIVSLTVRKKMHSSRCVPPACWPYPVVVSVSFGRGVCFPMSLIIIAGEGRLPVIGMTYESEDIALLHTSFSGGNKCTCLQTCNVDVITRPHWRFVRMFDSFW